MFKFTATSILVYVTARFLYEGLIASLSNIPCRLPCNYVVRLLSGLTLLWRFSRASRTSLTFWRLLSTKLYSPPALPVASICGTRVSRDMRGLRPTRSPKSVMSFGSVESGRVCFIQQAGKMYTPISYPLGQATHNFRAYPASTFHRFIRRRGYRTLSIGTRVQRDSPFSLAVYWKREGKLRCIVCC